MSRYELLYDLGCAFGARLDLDELLPLILSRCREVLNAESVAVLLLDSQRAELDFSYLSRETDEVGTRLVSVRVPAERGIAGAVLRSGDPVRIDDVQRDARFYPEVDRATGLTTRTLLCVPLKSRNETIGVVQVINRREGGVFDDDDLSLLTALGGSISIAIENARLYAEVKGDRERLQAQVGALRRDIARRDRFGEIVGSTPQMTEVFRLMESAAGSHISVLIHGETGTGKELVARGIHRASERADGPFIAINCAAFAESLLESELFGHRRGSFTGALQDKRGLFEAAGGGTIFLDEIGEMPTAMQAKLLRVLQESEIIVVGDTRPRKIDVRVISATNRNLEDEVKGRTFRQDLYYRVAAFPIALPPLRERREDIPVLAERILKSAAGRHRKEIAGIEPATLDFLIEYDWPGNVRELENEIERAVALARAGESIEPSHLSAKFNVAGRLIDLVVDGTADDGSLRASVGRYEAQLIRDALERNGGNQTRTAVELGLSRRALIDKLQKYALR
jgi:Nif-specific regulatory protein